MSLDAFANSMDQMMAAPSGVSSSSLSLRANTDYDMDDFTGRHDHRMGGVLDRVVQKNVSLNFTKVCFLAFLPLYFLIGTKHNPGKGWFFLLLITTGFIPLLYISWIHIQEPELKDMYILTIFGSIMFLVSALQVQKEAPVGGLGFLLFIQFCIFLYYLFTVSKKTGPKLKTYYTFIALAVIVAIVCLMPITPGTIAFVVILCFCFLVWFLITFNFISSPQILKSIKIAPF